MTRFVEFRHCAQARYVAMPRAFDAELIPTSSMMKARHDAARQDTRTKQRVDVARARMRAI